MKKYKLGRKKSHRASMLRSLGRDLVMKGRLKTTLAKAKALRPQVEKMVTKARRGRNSDKRELQKFFQKREVVEKMLSDVGPRFKDRPGGYTRIIKLGPRQADSAKMAVIEWVEEDKS